MKPAEAIPGDVDLVARMRDGDPDALRTVVERYQDRIFALLYGIVRDRHEVEDVAQEVFFKVFTRIAAFDGRSRFYTWLYRVAANTAKDHVKKRSRRPAVALDEEENFESDVTGPAAGAEKNELRRRVRDAIGTLPPRYREVLALRELQGLSYQEIAKVLRVSIGTVESRLHRARTRLKRVLEKHA
ncbi:MAG: RNA polymerase sigma factor [Planctomycetota bacterium]|jgi:RNA polymerase sigma-70 factor (ECF subfamily)